MKRLALAVVVAFIPTALAADDGCVEDVRALGMLYEIRDMVLSPATSSWEVWQRIDQFAEELREPLPDGRYRWVQLVRPEGGGPVQKRGHLVQAVHDTGDLDSFESSDTAVYAVRIVVPRKKSLFRANERVWVESVLLRVREEGTETTRTERIGKWMSPDTSRTIDLGLIADAVDVVADVATGRSTRGEALVEIHLVQAVSRDDPAGPHFETIQMLGRLRDSAEPATLDLEIGRLEQRLYPATKPLPVTLLLARLRDYDSLIGSEKPEDQEQARKLYAEIIRSARR